MFPSLLPIDGHACLDRRLWKIARLTPVFLWFCPSICDFGHVQSVIELSGKQVNNALSVHQITKRRRNHKKPEFRPSLRQSNARIFVQKTPVFRPSFYKNEPVWRIGYTDSPLEGWFLKCHLHSLLSSSSIRHDLHSFLWIMLASPTGVQNM